MPRQFPSVGLLIEFSATFGQVAEGEHAFDRYAKSVVFDYAYDRFHQDRYGKDFWHVRVQSRQDASVSAQQQTLTAALLAYWHQMACFRSVEGKQAAASLGLQVAAPLWVLLGLSVIGSLKNENDKQQTSDVVDVLAYLSAMLAQPARLGERLHQLLNCKHRRGRPAACRGAASQRGMGYPGTCRACAGGLFWLAGGRQAGLAPDQIGHRRTGLGAAAGRYLALLRCGQCG